MLPGLILKEALLLVFGRLAEHALHRHWLSKPKAHRNAIIKNEE